MKSGAYPSQEAFMQARRVRTTYGIKPWWRALCKWCVAGNEALALKTLKAFPRAIWFSLKTKSWEGTLWI